MLLAWKNAQRFDASTFFADGFGLGAFAEGFRQRETQGDHGDQQRDLLVRA
jgi:hypothetical protein